MCVLFSFGPRVAAQPRPPRPAPCPAPCRSAPARAAPPPPPPPPPPRSCGSSPSRGAGGCLPSAPESPSRPLFTRCPCPCCPPSPGTSSPAPHRRTEASAGPPPSPPGAPPVLPACVSPPCGGPGGAGALPGKSGLRPQARDLGGDFVGASPPGSRFKLSLGSLRRLVSSLFFLRIKDIFTRHFRLFSVAILIK